MADSIVARLERLGWKRNAAGVLCQPPQCPAIGLAVFSDWIGDRYRISMSAGRAARDLWIRGTGGQILGTVLIED